MLKKILINSITTAALLLSAQVFSAHHEEGEDGHKAKKHENRLEKYDTNKDGKLSKEEKITAREHHKAKIMKKYDTNKDGEISKEEKKAAKEAHRSKMIEKYDADGDGKLSAEEKSVAKESSEWKHHKGNRHHGKHKGKNKEKMNIESKQLSE